MAKLVTRTETHRISSNNDYFVMLSEFCHRSKNLYNSANYVINKENLGSNYYEIYESVKDSVDYKSMPTAVSAQQTLKRLSGNWSGFFGSLKFFKKNPDKFLGMPKPPGYLSKGGFYPVIQTGQSIKIKDGKLKFPKAYGGFIIKPRCIDLDGFVSIAEVSIIPKGRGSSKVTVNDDGIPEMGSLPDYLEVRIAYKILVPDELEDNGRIIGIDVGINNLVCVANNFGAEPFSINGKPVKSMNQYANKTIAEMKSELSKTSEKKSSRRIRRFFERRNRKIDNYLHWASKYIIDWCLKYDVHTIVIGKNKEWKNEVNLGKVTNQNFVSIPFDRLIDMISYKAENFGLNVVLTEESFTSGTSAPDDEMPVRDSYDKSRRITRGMFKTNSGKLINADLNAAYQIIRKVTPMKWSSGCGYHPVSVKSFTVIKDYCFT